MRRLHRTARWRSLGLATLLLASTAGHAAVPGAGLDPADPPPESIPPAVLAHFPVYHAEDLPALVENETGQPTLAVQVGEVTLGLVVAGQGEG